MKIAIVGATGLVGSTMLSELASGDFRVPVSELMLYASPRSAGTELEFRGEQYKVMPLAVNTLRECDIALFAVGADIAKIFAPLFVEQGAVVIDNSSAFRLKPECPLVVPEVNAHTIGNAKIIANPNCSTIQLVVALAPLCKYGIESVIVSTYQAVSGGKTKLMQQLVQEYIELVSFVQNSTAWNLCDKHPFAKRASAYCTNVVPAIGDLDAFGEYTEEAKLRFETKRILGRVDLPVSATCVRVPVFNGHSEAVCVNFSSEFCFGDVVAALNNAPSVVVENDYVTPIDISGRREVFVSRIRRDRDFPNMLRLWIVSDNLRKGAATNAVQIAEFIANR